MGVQLIDDGAKPISKMEKDRITKKMAARKKCICPDGHTEVDSLSECPPKKAKVKSVGTGGIAEDIFYGER